MRKDAVDAGNKEAKIESGVDQNRTKHDPTHKRDGEIPGIPGAPPEGGSEHERDAPKNPIPMPGDQD